MLSTSRNDVLTNEASQNDSFKSEDTMTVKPAWIPRFPDRQKRE